jgi:hypothetical protein
MPLRRQSALSRQPIANKGLKNLFFFSQSRQRTEKNQLKTNQTKAENGVQCVRTREGQIVAGRQH